MHILKYTANMLQLGDIIHQQVSAEFASLLQENFKSEIVGAEASRKHQHSFM